MKTALVLSIACLASQFAPAAQAQPQPSQTFAVQEFGRFYSRDVAEIEQVLKKYEQALNASDVKGVLKLHTDDAVFMVPLQWASRP